MLLNKRGTETGGRSPRPRTLLGHALRGVTNTSQGCGAPVGCGSCVRQGQCGNITEDAPEPHEGEHQESQKPEQVCPHWRDADVPGQAGMGLGDPKLTVRSCC